MKGLIFLFHFLSLTALAQGAGAQLSPALVVEGTNSEGQPFKLSAISAEGEGTQRLVQDLTDGMLDGRMPEGDFIVSYDPEQVAAVKDAEPQFAKLPKARRPILLASASRIVKTMNRHQAVICFVLQTALTWTYWLHFAPVTAGEGLTSAVVSSVMTLGFIFRPQMWLKYLARTESMARWGAHDSSLGESKYFKSGVNLASIFGFNLLTASMYKTIMSWDSLAATFSLMQIGSVAVRNTFLSNYDVFYRRVIREGNKNISQRELFWMLRSKAIVLSVVAPLLLQGSTIGKMVWFTLAAGGIAFAMNGEKIFEKFNSLRWVRTLSELAGPPTEIYYKLSPDPLDSMVDCSSLIHLLQ